MFLNSLETKSFYSFPNKFEANFTSITWNYIVKMNYLVIYLISMCDFCLCFFIKINFEI